MTRVAGAIASVVLVAVAVTLALRGDEGGRAASEKPDQPARIVTPSQLESLASRLGHPLYWARRRPSYSLEVREDGETNVFVRYLPAGTEPGEASGSFLSVGTYPVEDAVAALRRSAVQGGGTLERTAGAVVVRGISPGSVYFAYPGSDLQVEVYDPRPGRSLRLIRAGAIRPVG